MALPPSRDMYAELAEGMTDGDYKKVTRNRGGAVEVGTYKSRRHLFDTYYGVHEVAVKDLPDGTSRPTPDYVVTQPPMQIP
jgi:hypothetical protein